MKLKKISSRRTFVGISLMSFFAFCFPKRAFPQQQMNGSGRSGNEGAAVAREARRQKKLASAQFREGKFHNTLP